MIHIGIDPGVTGALATLDSVTREVEFHDTPTVQVKSGKTMKNMLDAPKIVLMLQNLSTGRDVRVTIEKVNAMPPIRNTGTPPSRVKSYWPDDVKSYVRELEQKVFENSGPKMGATSAFNFGKGYGIWLGVLAALLLPYDEVHPMTWKKTIMADMSKEKDASRVKAMQCYPHAAKDLNLKKHHGRADALLLAEFGRRNHF